MKWKSFGSVVIFSSIVLFVSSCKKDEVTNLSKDNVSSGRPFAIDSSALDESKTERATTRALVFDFLPVSTTNQIVKHQYYSLSYNEEYEQAEWVAYELKSSYVKNNNFKRPFFIKDIKVKTGSADWRNYKKSSLDKGHLCPAGDMEFDVNGYNDTFLTSNIAPQEHNFNNGVWNRLEQKVRYWAVKYDGLYVVTGGVLEPTLATIGKEKVAVPKLFYKIVLRRSEKNCKMIGFLIPNKESNAPLYQFVVSVDAIEKLTGINFFPKLNDVLENTLEKGSSYKNWSFE
ncbi:DNA/RNA non-specific endonuclease [Flavobacterium sp. ZT3P35]|uniref:DNA/RNA non-specific endonuclease n=1 Tax=Flavobacterium sp. ZT3P35 TaxID=3401727 RepID=UPI003AACC558